MAWNDLQKVEEIIEIKMLKLKYFRGSIWNIVDLVWIQIDLLFHNLNTWTIHHVTHVKIP